MPGEQEEKFEQQEVTYTLEVDDRLVVVEKVPARVSLRTGERFFSPKTVERLQAIIWEQRPPSRIIQTPVYEFSETAA